MVYFVCGQMLYKNHPSQRPGPFFRLANISRIKICSKKTPGQAATQSNAAKKTRRSCQWSSRHRHRHLQRQSLIQCRFPAGKENKNGGKKCSKVAYVGIKVVVATHRGSEASGVDIEISA